MLSFQPKFIALLAATLIQTIQGEFSSPTTDVLPVRERGLKIVDPKTMNIHLDSCDDHPDFRSLTAEECNTNFPKFESLTFAQIIHPLMDETSKNYNHHQWESYYPSGGNLSEKALPNECLYLDKHNGATNGYIQYSAGIFGRTYFMVTNVVDGGEKNSCKNVHHFSGGGGCLCVYKSKPTAAPTAPPIVTPHPCNDGSHGCDTLQSLGGHGVCSQIEPDSQGRTWECSCSPTHECFPDCHTTNHTCRLKTSSPTTSSPTYGPITSFPTIFPTISPSAPTNSPSIFVSVPPTTSSPTSTPSTSSPTFSSPTSNPTAIVRNRGLKIVDPRTMGVHLHYCDEHPNFRSLTAEECNANSKFESDTFASVLHPLKHLGYNYHQWESYYLKGYGNFQSTKLPKECLYYDPYAGDGKKYFRFRSHPSKIGRKYLMVNNVADASLNNSCSVVPYWRGGSGCLCVYDPKPTAAPTTSPTTHPCEDGSHGCDTLQSLGGHGVCSQIEPDSQGRTWQCSCSPTHECFPDCQTANHTCRLKTSSPTTSSPTFNPITSFPTVQPTSSPTTSSPTSLPTSSPTVQPTSIPTVSSPTFSPTSSSESAAPSVLEHPEVIVLVCLISMFVAIVAIYAVHRHRKSKKGQRRTAANPKYNDGIVEMSCNTENPLYEDPRDKYNPLYEDPYNEGSKENSSVDDGYMQLEALDLLTEEKKYDEIAHEVGADYDNIGFIANESDIVRHNTLRI